MSIKDKGALGILFFIGLFFVGITYLQGTMPWGLLIPLSALGILFSIIYTVIAMRNEEKNKIKSPSGTDTTN